MRIAVDVMGGDHGCGVVINGVKLALEADSRISSILLVGQEDKIHPALAAAVASLDQGWQKTDA